MLVTRWRWALLTLGLISNTIAQGLQVVNGQIFGSGLAIFNSPQPETPMGGDTLHLSIDVSGNGRLQLPPYADNFRNGIASLNIFLTSTVTGLNLTISNGTFAGWDRDALDTPEFLCNSTDSNGDQNAGCRSVMLQEAGSTVKHVNWVWPRCFVGNGGANDGNCLAGGDLRDCLDGTARGPYNVSFHEALRVNGTDFYTITDLPIRVTNSIPEDTRLAGSQIRPRCDLRNNPLLSYAVRDAAIRPPTSFSSTGSVPTDSSQGGSSGQAPNGNTGGSTNDSTGGSIGGNTDNNGVVNPGLPGAPNAGSLGPDGLGPNGSSARSNSISWPLLWMMAVAAACLYQS